VWWFPLRVRSVRILNLLNVLFFSLLKTKLLVMGGVTTRFSLDLFFNYFYMCVYVINCLYVYFGGNYWNSVLEGYF